MRYPSRFQELALVPCCLLPPAPDMREHTFVKKRFLCKDMAMSGGKAPSGRQVHGRERCFPRQYARCAQTSELRFSFLPVRGNPAGCGV